ncbi:VWA domain-containing protein [Candidatus Woesearchaeota archaeon]|nr:VWA domain-containing protein [Candidatus Woesearchaeota archaeon]
MIGRYVGSFCYQSYCLERPYLLLVIVPVFLSLLFLIYKNFIRFHDKAERKIFTKKKKWLRIFVLAARSIAFFMILAALALPFTTEETITHGEPIIRILSDNSRSMEIFDSELLEKARDKLGKEYSIELSQISSGTNSELGQGILSNIQGNDNLFIISDGNNIKGKKLLDVGMYTRVSNTRIFALDIEPERNDAYVTMKGPSEAIAGTPSRFTFTVEYVGSQPAFTLQVYIDDKLEFSGQNVFSKDIVKVLGEGYHKVSAKIIIDDYFSENNVFYKSVKAVPKPKVAFVSKKKSPLEEGIKSIYELKAMAELPPSLDKYHAVVLNDIPYSSLKNRIDDITGYLLDGGGIVFIGGRNSFDKGSYEGTLLESLLPVKIGTGKIIDPFKHNIVIVLDVSESFSDFSYKKGGSKTALDLGKGIAVKMIEQFRDDISVGLAAFAAYGQILSQPVELAGNRKMLSGIIERLGSGQGTSIDQGLIMAEAALEKVKGTKNVILISDGKMGHQELPHAPLRIAERMAGKGIKIYTVGLPSELYDVDVNRVLMTKLAQIGNGNYFEPNEYQYLNVFFGKPEAKDKVFFGNSNLAVMDRNHFITEDLSINSRITGLNFVIPKMGTRNLVYTGDGNPVLNSGRFGLGRIVTLATDDGTEWAGSLLTKENSLLLTRIINYAVGNPEKDKELYIDAGDGFLGEGNEIMVRSDKYPVSKQLTFAKQEENLYKALFTADEAGYYQFFDALVAINHHREYHKLGLNPELQDMAELSGGKMLDLDDEEIIEQIKTFSERKETARKDLKLYPLGIALAAFIIELIIRKIYEHKGSFVEVSKR